jgi:hypothetical protein
LPVSNSGRPQAQRRAGDPRPVALVLALDAHLERHGQEARLPLGRDRVFERLDGEARRLEVEPPRGGRVDLGERRILRRQRRQRHSRPTACVPQTEQPLHRLAVRRGLELGAHAFGTALGRRGARLRELELAEIAGREQRLRELRRRLLRRLDLAHAVGHGTRGLRARERGAGLGDEIEHRRPDLELGLLHRGLADALAQRHDQQVEQLEAHVPRIPVRAAAAEPAAAEGQPREARRLREIGLCDAGALERGTELGIALDRDRHRGVGVQRTRQERLLVFGRRCAGLGIEPPGGSRSAARCGQSAGVVQRGVGSRRGATRGGGKQNDRKQRAQGTGPGAFGM